MSSFSTWSSIKGEDYRQTSDNTTAAQRKDAQQHYSTGQGFGNEYSAGRGEKDSAFEYYRKHASAANAQRRIPMRSDVFLAAPVQSQTYQRTGGTILKESNPVEMSCMHCKNGNCMYANDGPQGCVGPYCADCHRSVLDSGATQQLK